MSQLYRVLDGVTTTLPRLDAQDIQKELTKEDLQVLILLAESGYTETVNDLQEKTGLSLVQVAHSIDALLSKHLLKEIPKEQQEPYEPHIARSTTLEDALEIEANNRTPFIRTCAEIMQKESLDRTSISTVLYLLKQMDVSEYYITTLLSYCVNIWQARGIHYLKTTCTSLCNKGIRSDDALDEYLKDRELVHQHEVEIKRLYGFGKRALTDKELITLTKWFGEYHFQMNIIGMAYDETVAHCQNVTINYTDKILKTWFENGLHTEEQIQAYLEKHRQEEAQKHRKKVPEVKPQEYTSFNAEDFIQAAIEHSYGKKEDPQG